MQSFFSGFTCLCKARDKAIPSPDSKLNLDVSFGDWALMIEYSDECDLIEEDGISVLLYGYLYKGLKTGEIPGLYRKHGKMTGRYLAGSYAMLIIDHKGKKAVIISDRTSSRPLYLWHEQDCWMVSTSWFRVAGSLPGQAELDYAGVAWYLSNGVIHNSHTLFRNICRLEKATSYTADIRIFEPFTYWDFDFLDAPGSGEAEKYLPRLKETLAGSVSDCLPANEKEPVFLSLSAGYDSSGLLAVLKYSLGRQGIKTFSYGLDEVTPQSDPYLARELAAMAGYDHSFVLSYAHDFVNSIETNALWGDGMSNFCDEVHTWQQLMPGVHNDRPACLFGDTIFWSGNIKTLLADEAEVLESIMIRDSGYLPWLVGYVPAESFSRFRRVLEEECRLLLEKSRKRSRCLLDQAHYLVLETRSRNAHAPWRANFCSRAFIPYNPWYHDDCLELNKSIPASLRDQKSLFIKAVREIAPELFKEERARRMGYVPDWKTEIKRNKDLILEKYLLNMENPQLDSIIPAETVIQIMTKEILAKNMVNKSGVFHTWLKKIPFVSKPPAKPALKRKILAPEKFILRYLVLKRTLELVGEKRREA